MGAEEIQAFGDFGPVYGTILILAVILVPVLVPMLNRERKKSHDPFPELMGQINGMRANSEAKAREIERLRAEFVELRRDHDKLEHRFDLWSIMERKK
ncbi:hypothetical protein [Paracoccus homiensis]|uniref:Phage shock protein B n=1 Tax=Paracoccus homiensis TaxID=364199 RepID=A0A1I0J1N0_9RHOB|nr:hypothetical protein [Paracoccus homiensis]SEU03556.1 hypothetical protein SAMN04489858_12078 [Paracoccus homiensis]